MLLLRLFGVVMALTLASVAGVYGLRGQLPSGGVLELTNERRTLHDLGLGLTLHLPYGRGVSFAPDRERFVVHLLKDTPAAHSYHYLGSIHSDERQFLHRDRTELLRFAPVWSPDGAQLAFARRAAITTPAQLFLLTLADGRVRALTDWRVELGALRWWPDGARLLAAASDGEQFDLLTVDARSGVVEWLTRTPHDELSPLVAPDGQTVYYTQTQGSTWSVHALHLAHSTSRLLITGEFILAVQDISPDGRWLALVEMAPGQGFAILRYDLFTGRVSTVLEDAPVSEVRWW